jgi:acetylornithine deacetylase/succinyl-diaminopimelate desuccinylase-like protein
MCASVSGDQTTIYQRPVELLQNLIRFDTSNPPGNEAECITYINALLTQAGFETTIVAKVPHRPNLFARLSGQGNEPPLLLYGHIDVQITKNQVWQHPPFEAKLVDGYIWGRGALDMKSGIAMMLAAFMKAKAEGLNPAGDIVLAVLSDEEQFGDFGARYLVESHPELFKDIRYALGEFGGFSMHIAEKRFYPIQVAEKQICSVKVIVNGPGGHGSLPLRGGAMAKLGHILQQLDQQRLPVHINPIVRDMVQGIASAVPSPVDEVVGQLLDPGQTDSVLELLGTQGQGFEPLFHNTVNATIVHGGDNINVIPSEIVLQLDGRLLPGFTPDDIVTELRQLIGNEAVIEVQRYDPCPAEPDMELFPLLEGILKEADPDGLPVPLLMPAVTDGRFLSKLGIQTYGFTPMKLPEGFNFMQTIHNADERIPVEALAFGADAIHKVLQRFGS